MGASKTKRLRKASSNFRVNYPKLYAYYANACSLKAQKLKSAEA